MITDRHIFEISLEIKDFTLSKTIFILNKKKRENVYYYIFIEKLNHGNKLWVCLFNLYFENK